MPLRNPAIYLRCDYEIVDLSQLDLIRRYPSYFKSKLRRFEDFFVSNIAILLRKTA